MATAKLANMGEGWKFVGKDVPELLKGRWFGDQYAATRYANERGYDIFANGDVRPFAPEPPPGSDATDERGAFRSGTGYGGERR